MEPLNYRTYNQATDTERYQFPSNLPNRPGVNTQGKAIKIRVNQYKVLQWPQRDVYQFDVSTITQLFYFFGVANNCSDLDWHWC